MKKELLLGLCLFSLISLYSQVSESSNSFKLKRGAYINFNELLSNNPCITDSFYIETIDRGNKNWAGTYSCTPMYVETNKRIKKIWGYSDGTRAYIYHEKEFFPIEIEKNQYWFVGYGRVETNGAGGAAAGAVLAGAIGAGIGGGIASSVALTKAHNRKVKYVYDINSGEEISPYHSLPKTWNLQGAKLIFYRRDKRQSDEPINFIVNDSLQYSFIPNSYERLFFAFGCPPVKVCFGKNSSSSFIVELKGDESKYIECSLSEKDNIPTFEEVETADGEYYSSKPKKVQNKLNEKKPEVRVSPYRSHANTWNLVGANIIFYRRDRNQTFEPFNFIINDSLQYSFYPNSYENLFIPLGNPPVKVCFGSEFNDCFDFELNENDTKYIECYFSEKDGIPKLIEVNDAEGKYFASKPKKEQEKRDQIRYEK